MPWCLLEIQIDDKPKLCNFEWNEWEWNPRKAAFFLVFFSRYFRFVYAKLYCCAFQKMTPKISWTSLGLHTKHASCLPCTRSNMILQWNASRWLTPHDIYMYSRSIGRFYHNNHKIEWQRHLFQTASDIGRNTKRLTVFNATNCQIYFRGILVAAFYS